MQTDIEPASVEVKPNRRRGFAGEFLLQRPADIRAPMISIGALAPESTIRFPISSTSGPRKRVEGSPKRPRRFRRPRTGRSGHSYGLDYIQRIGLWRLSTTHFSSQGRNVGKFRFARASPTPGWASTSVLLISSTSDPGNFTGRRRLAAFAIFTASGFRVLCND